jgi:hypothetical protein
MPDSPGRHCKRERWHYLRCRLSLAQLRRIKDWQTAHRVQQPIECWAWETVMTIWVIALIGWLPRICLERPGCTRRVRSVLSRRSCTCSCAQMHKPRAT